MRPEKRALMKVVGKKITWSELYEILLESSPGMREDIWFRQLPYNSQYRGEYSRTTCHTTETRCKKARKAHCFSINPYTSILEYQKHKMYKCPYLYPAYLEEE